MLSFRSILLSATVLSFLSSSASAAATGVVEQRASGSQPSPWACDYACPTIPDSSLFYGESVTGNDINCYYNNLLNPPIDMFMCSYGPVAGADTSVTYLVGSRNRPVCAPTSGPRTCKTRKRKNNSVETVAQRRIRERQWKPTKADVADVVDVTNVVDVDDAAEVADTADVVDAI
ncbi:hypothetical protein [Phaffia rhodozyma]|uniref:Uncharacterized protein n=1 Tax=Phaffia rhodozyma TaxID=264483 RepID=A0A0F7SED4_PHARH|nr:hypothetical protein [Phaffia rhodozyma]